MDTPAGQNVFSQILILLLPNLLGGGIILYIIKYLASWRKSNRKFDLKMDEFIKNNKQLNDKLISYVSRSSLDEKINVFLDNDYRYCVILGPAGCGKTRFAQHITHRNKLFSKYHFVYINDRNGKFFASDIFKNDYVVNGNRRYVFMFDYFYENLISINNLMDKATLSGRHKFIFIERDYGREAATLLDRPDFSIIMTEHNMDKNMLASVFCNQVTLLNKKIRKSSLYQIALYYADLIIEKIDYDFRRPIFSLLIAQIFVQNKDFKLDNIIDKAQLISNYWYYKLNLNKLKAVCTDQGKVDFTFISQLDTLLRILVLSASISKQSIRVRKTNILLFEIEYGDSEKLNNLINSALSRDFFDYLNTMNLDKVMQLFSIVLKHLIKARDNYFTILPELDLISEWVIFDSLKKREENWLPKLTRLLSSLYQENYKIFIKRGSINFTDLVELQDKLYYDNAKYKDFIELINQFIDEAFLTERYEKYVIIIQELMTKMKKIYNDGDSRRIAIEFLTKIKNCYMLHNQKKLSEQLQSLVADPVTSNLAKEGILI